MNTEASRKTVDRREPIAQDNRINLTPYKNKTSGKDAAFAIQICRKFLKVLGVWLHSDAGVFSWRTILRNVAVILCCFGMCIRSIPCLLYIIYDEKRPAKRVLLISRCVFVGMCATKYSFLQWHRKNIDSCMKHVEFDWLKVQSTASRNIMLEHARFGHLVTRICVAFTYAGATFQAIMPIVLQKVLSDNSHGTNVTAMPHARRFALPSHFGHPIFSTTPFYEFIYSSQEIATVMMHSIAIACYSLTVVMGMHACGQLKILIGKLSELVDGGGEMSPYDSVNGRMADIISHHVRVLRFVSSAEKILRGICLIEVGGCTIGLCFLGYLSMMEFRKAVKQPMAICAYTTLFVTFTFNIFSFCYIGELLTEECMRVGEMAYMIDWHRLPGKQSLGMGLMMTMTHNPVTLTAGGALQLSFRCFASVIRTSMGYLNMLRTVVD